MMGGSSLMRRGGSRDSGHQNGPMGGRRRCAGVTESLSGWSRESETARVRQVSRTSFWVSITGRNRGGCWSQGGPGHVTSVLSWPIHLALQIEKLRPTEGRGLAKGRAVSRDKIRESSDILLSPLRWVLWVNESPDGSKPYLIETKP